MGIELKKVVEALVSGARIHKKAMDQIPGGEDAVKVALKAEGQAMNLDSSGHFVLAAKEAKVDAKS
jgi:hypothetical protein